jgi:hypothetical protein
MDRRAGSSRAYAGSDTDLPKDVNWPEAGADPPRGDIPSVSFVSYWAGLLIATRVLLNAPSVATAETRKVVQSFSLRPDRPIGLARRGWGQPLEPVAQLLPTRGGFGGTRRNGAAPEGFELL